MIFMALLLISLILIGIFFLKIFREMRAFNEADLAFYREMASWDKEDVNDG